MYVSRFPDLHVWNSYSAQMFTLICVTVSGPTCAGHFNYQNVSDVHPYMFHGFRT